MRMEASEMNVADRLATMARDAPTAIAVARAGSGERRGIGRYETCTFAELDADALALARGLVDLGVGPGTRLVLLVKPGLEFVKLVFALLRSGATTVLVDPGMGRKHLVNCLAAAEPEGFVAISSVQAVRTVLRRRFASSRLNVTIGRRWFWGGVTYDQLRDRGRASSAPLPTPKADDPAAIIFTSGSTGPPKGVLYTHCMFETQAAEIQRAYDLRPGGVDLSCFALFGLFNSAWGVTTVFPDMDFARPASADPRKLLAAANDWHVTQAFASPAVWDKLSRHGAASGERIPTLRQVFSCGAPVRAAVLERTLAMVHPHAEMHTPYGATEALPVATIEADEVLGETATRTAHGAGVCVGRKFDSIEWRVIRISDEPIATLEETRELTPGEIGELIVQGPQVSPAYLDHPAPSPLRGGLGRGWEAGTSFNHPSLTLPIEGRGPEGNPPAEPAAAAANAIAKIYDGDAVWHRMGDVGYLDDSGRFWYCGRKSQRVVSTAGPLFTEQVEAIFNQHGAVRRCALVGDGGQGFAAPVVVIEAASAGLSGSQTGELSDRQFSAWEQLVDELVALAAEHPPAAGIGQFLLHRSLPVDVRHNAKINRESLAAWAVGAVADHKLRPHPTKRHVLTVRAGTNHPQR